MKRRHLDMSMSTKSSKWGGNPQRNTPFLFVLSFEDQKLRLRAQPSRKNTPFCRSTKSAFEDHKLRLRAKPSGRNTLPFYKYFPPKSIMFPNNLTFYPITCAFYRWFVHMFDSFLDFWCIRHSLWHPWVTRNMCQVFFSNKSVVISCSLEKNT